MRENLSESLKLIFGHEGGYSSAKTDRGNYLNGVLVGTKYGITGATLAGHRGVKTVTAADVRNMTLAEAEDIYRKSYWTQSGGDLLPSGLDYAAFDFGVNSGPARAIKTLQKVVGVAQDGIVGGQTLTAVENYPGGVVKLIVDYCDARMAFLRSLGGAQGFAANGRGWTIRVTGKDPLGKWADQPGVRGNALAMARRLAPKPSEVPPDVPDGKARDEDRSIVDIVKQPEAWGPLGGLVSALTALAAGSGPVQWALAAVMVVGVGVGIWYVVRRARSQ